MTDRLSRRTARARRAAALVPAAAAALVLTACGDGADEEARDNAQWAASSAAAEVSSPASSGEEAPEAAPWATAKLVKADGAEAGDVEFADGPGGVAVTVRAQGLTPGFHGMHLHEIGLCEPNSVAPGGGEPGDFNSSGSHIAGPHGDHHRAGEGQPRKPGEPTVGHAGDLPPLLVKEDGTAELTVVTDRLTRELLLDADGSAVIVHEGADNFGNVPERYAPEGPDADTMKTGDAGARALCGVIAPA
ncbi:superoxide dismutase family protein [Corynebacterium sp. 335C]